MAHHFSTLLQTARERDGEESGWCDQPLRKPALKSEEADVRGAHALLLASASPTPMLITFVFKFFTSGCRPSQVVMHAVEVAGISILAPYPHHGYQISPSIVGETVHTSCTFGGGREPGS